MPESDLFSTRGSPRVRFAPSPTGFLHVGSARTFIFNWLYARHNGGTMVLRIDDTDVERNTEASVQSIFEGLSWLGLDWDEEYKQSERLDLHRQAAEAIFAKGLGLSRLYAGARGRRQPVRRAGCVAVQSRHARAFARGERPARQRPASRLRCAIACRAAKAGRCALLMACMARSRSWPTRLRTLRFVAGSDGMPTYHLASCVDDADLRISHIIRGQDHLTNTFKHLLIFEGLDAEPPQFAHLAAAGCARRDETFKAQARAGGERDYLSRCGIFAAGVSSTFCACWVGRPRTIANL